ncbi:MAG: hypothetical protein IKY66_03515 [Bacteroidales bacterium]|nr:hypothetical protein [Bacteroidales bacterium]
MDRIKIKNSTVNITINLRTDSLKNEIENFDIASKTPIDCMEFIRKIKKKLSDGTL